MEFRCEKDAVYKKEKGSYYRKTHKSPVYIVILFNKDLSVNIHIR